MGSAFLLRLGESVGHRHQFIIVFHEDPDRFLLGFNDLPLFFNLCFQCFNKPVLTGIFLLLSCCMFLSPAFYKSISEMNEKSESERDHILAF